MSDPVITAETIEPIEPAPKRRSPVPYVVGIIVVVALLVGVVVIAMDGDGGGTDDPVALLSAAPDAARDAGTAHMAMTMAMDGAGLTMELEGSGVVDFETGAGRFEMSMLGLDISVISDGETVWMQTPTEVQGKSWIALPAEQFANTDQQLASIDSAAGMLEALRGIGAEDIEDHGVEEINGVEARHYSTIVDLEDAIASAPEANREQAEAALRQFDAFGAVEMPIDVWITDDGLPVRQVMTFASTAEAPTGLPPFEVRIQLDMSDFGEPVDIQPPDPADVLEVDNAATIDELFGGAGGLPS